ncbi:four helix bundle protein [Salinivirga cyanobacteriivorans]|uniref:Four helix bundle protein n=1 Tax=Salinivirga cyanobacteriivorans TaxID=1307839 RepID=A0A0S2I0P2_9BACT|nr:four helix bundle protein [Salinivirga cyanobacteriivorans]ALO15749.1 four helix bundle protein [Salinivirga cyanobacteriivorans]
MKTHKDLDAWKKAIEFVTRIYNISTNFPSHELYGLSSQIRRAAVSIPSNIAEGALRKGNLEFTRFLYISLSSAAEVETQLIIAKNLKYISEIDFNDLQNELETISKLIQGLIRYLKK